MGAAIIEKARFSFSSIGSVRKFFYKMHHDLLLFSLPTLHLIIFCSASAHHHVLRVFFPLLLIALSHPTLSTAIHLKGIEMEQDLACNVNKCGAQLTGQALVTACRSVGSLILSISGHSTDSSIAMRYVWTAQLATASLTRDPIPVLSVVSP